MNNLRDAMLKAGLVSQNDLEKVEAQKKENARLQTDRRNSIAKQRLTLYALLGDLSRKMVESTHRTIKELICSKCGAEGSTRVDVMAVHAHMYTMIGVPTETFVKRLFFVAYKASVVMGMGMFRAKDNTTEDEVWKNICGQEDYLMNHNTPNNLYADYVFGKMMKIEVRFTEKKFEVMGGRLSPDYQSWALIYPTVDKLVEATANTFPNVVVL